MAWGQAENQAYARQLGYTGDFGGGGFTSFLASNPNAYLQYTTARKNADPTWQNSIDLDPNQGGIQTWSPSINQAAGQQVGYYGPTGRGELGSGTVGVDYLNIAGGPQAQQQYNKIRSAADPNYKYTEYQKTPVGFSEQGYLNQNPDVAQWVNEGKYISGTQHYLLEGQNQGRGYDTENQINDQYSMMTDRLNAILDSLNRLNSPQETVKAPTLPARGSGELPTSLADLRDLNDMQRRTALATRSLYGTGLSRDESNYYFDLLRKNDEEDSQNWSLQPVETQFLQSKGIPFNSSEAFLNGLAQYYASM